MRISDWSSDVCSSDLALYGKTGPEFTLDEVAQARQGAKDCRGQVGKAEAKRLAGLETQVARVLGGTLKAIAKAEPQPEAALEAFAAGPDGAGKLPGLATPRARKSGG